MAEERAPNYAEGAGLFWRKQAHAASVCPQGLNQSPRHKQGSSWGTKGTAEIKDSSHQSLPLGYLGEPTTGSGSVRRQETSKSLQSP